MYCKLILSEMSEDEYKFSRVVPGLGSDEVCFPGGMNGPWLRSGKVKFSSSGVRRMFPPPCTRSGRTNESFHLWPCRHVSSFAFISVLTCLLELIFHYLVRKACSLHYTFFEFLIFDWYMFYFIVLHWDIRQQAYLYIISASRYNILVTGMVSQPLN